jgi:hypothetical protein
MSKVKYSATSLQDEKAVNALIYLYKFHNSIKSKERVVVTEKEFERDVIKPLEKLLSSRTQREKSNRATHLTEKRGIRKEFVKIYNRLENNGANLSNIASAKQEEQATLQTCYKLLNIYVAHFNLKGGKKSKTFALDPFLEGCFSSSLLSELYEKNEGDVISQGQLMKLASLLLRHI